MTRLTIPKLTVIAVAFWSNNQGRRQTLAQDHQEDKMVDINANNEAATVTGVNATPQATGGTMMGVTGTPLGGGAPLQAIGVKVTPVLGGTVMGATGIAALLQAVSVKTGDPGGVNIGVTTCTLAGRNTVAMTVVQSGRTALATTVTQGGETAAAATCLIGLAAAMTAAATDPTD